VIHYAAAADLLEAYGAAWAAFDGDAWVALYTEDAEYHGDPFADALVGHNALRAWLLDAAADVAPDGRISRLRRWASFAPGSAD
jgi:hypothetical protein